MLMAMNVTYGSVHHTCMLQEVLLLIIYSPITHYVLVGSEGPGDTGNREVQKTNERPIK